MEPVHLLPPTTSQRIRRKTREVSSRYMTTPATSPFVSSLSQNQNNRGTFSIYSSSPESSDAESEFPNENLLPPSNRKLDTPLPFNPQIKTSGTGRKAAIRLFVDNGASSFIKARPGTPFGPKGTTLSNTHVGNGRINAKNTSVSPRVFTSKSSETFSDNSSVVSNSEFENFSDGKNGRFCDNPINGSRVRRNQDGFRNSMPETAMLPPLSSRRIRVDQNENQRSNSSVKGPACCRSLNLGIPITQQDMCQNKKGRSIPSKLCLPPPVPSSRLNGAGKKGKQENVHMLKLLENRYLQWRFINARAKEAASSRTIRAEKTLYDVSNNIVEMRNVVIEKRMEAHWLRRMQILSYILESQMPLLNDCSNLKEGYFSSLTGVTNALNNCLVKVPTSENVKADVNELEEIFDEMINIFESLSPNVQRCIPETESIINFTSELAVIASIERALVEECGSLLSEAHNLQVIESSLRGQLIQAKQSRGV